MNSFAERLLENDLAEMLGGKRPPDLTEKALARLAGQTAPVAEKPLAPIVRPQFHRRWVRWLEAACIVIALGGITWLLWPGNRNTDLPSGVKASPDAAYAVSKAAIRLDKGWLYIESGAPTIMVGDDRVDHIEGRAVIKARGLTPQEALEISRQESLRDLSPKEKDMLSNPKRWLAIGGVSICLFSGSIAVNGQTVAEKYKPEPEVEHKIEPKEEADNPGTADRKATGFVVLRDYTGDDSNIAEEEYQLIQNQKDLETVLYRHKGDGWDKLPLTVDFSKEMVVAIFAGKSTNMRALSIAGIFKTEDHYLMRTEAVHYQSVGRGKKTTSFGFFVLPINNCRIVVERSEIREMHGRPIWRVAHVFDQGAGVVPGLRAGEGGALKTHTGDNSDLKDMRLDPPEYCRLVRTQAEFDKLWASHTNAAKPWDVDFEKHNIVFVLQLQSRNSRGLILEETLVNADTRVLRLRNDVDFTLVDDDARRSTPWAMFLVPKDKRDTVIESKEIFLRVPQELIPEYDPDDNSPRKPIYKARGDGDPVYWDEVATLKG
ncbi:MAG: hypothetical protein IT462_10235 [Planctomycetes bacterium]|nr:hypothetical protein [Planctomycetota bacterium]